MQQRYSRVAIVLHWLLALALAFQLSMGLGLDDLGVRGFSAFQLHKSVGIAVLLLSVLRLFWRLAYKPPPAAATGVTAWLANAVHFGLYVFMIGAPLTGWLLVSTETVRVPTLLFGVLPLPHLPLPQASNGFAHWSHAMLGWLGIALILLHVAGALRHQWLLKDNLMGRMAPARGLWMLLALLVPIGWAVGMAMVSDREQSPAQQETPVTIEEQAAAPAAMETPANEAEPVAPPTSVATNPPVWTIKPGGTLAFSVRNDAVPISGSFTRWGGEIAFDPDHAENAKIRMTIDLASASVGDATQDSMLAGSDFLDVSAHPRATFRTTSVRQTGPNRYTAQGVLSLKGTSRPQTLTFSLTGAGLTRHVEGQAVIDRSGFGVGQGETASALAPTVTVSFSFDATGTVSQ
jgi:cytochrome b561/polyisoprenoid-binding protein YceI